MTASPSETSGENPLRGIHAGKTELMNRRVGIASKVLMAAGLTGATLGFAAGADFIGDKQADARDKRADIRAEHATKVTMPETTTPTLAQGENATVLAERLNDQEGYNLDPGELNQWANEIHEANQENGYVYPDRPMTVHQPRSTGPLGDK